MADLTYGDIRSDLIAFAEGKLEGATGGALRLINRACRYIQDFYSGQWEHLLVRDYPRVIDSTGYGVALPADFNKLYRVFRNTKERFTEMGETDFRIQVSSPADLSAAPTVAIRYWTARNVGEARYISYWRKMQLFTLAGGDTQVPDLPNSGETILTVSKWLTARNERNANQNEVVTLKTEAEDAVRRLKGIDDATYSENTFDNPVENYDGFTYDSYSLDGDDNRSRRTNPLL